MTLRLRNRNEGLDLELLDGFLRAIDDCRLEWEQTEKIPRVAVSLLVELPYVILTEASFYEEPERTAAVDAAFTVYDRINHAVGVDGEPPGDWRTPEPAAEG